MKHFFNLIIVTYCIWTLIACNTHTCMPKFGSKSKSNPLLSLDSLHVYRGYYCAFRYTFSPRQDSNYLHGSLYQTGDTIWATCGTTFVFPIFNFTYTGLIDTLHIPKVEPAQSCYGTFLTQLETSFFDLKTQDTVYRFRWLEYNAESPCYDAVFYLSKSQGCLGGYLGGYPPPLENTDSIEHIVSFWGNIFIETDRKGKRKFATLNIY